MTRYAPRKVARLAMVLAALFTLITCAIPAAAARLKHKVAVADVAQVDEVALDELRDASHAVMVSETAAGGMAARVKEARAEVNRSQEQVRAEAADMAAAKAERKAAGKNEDEARLEAAEELLSGSRDSLAQARAHLRWARRSLDAHKAERDRADAALALARAELELARVRLLADQRVPAAENYAAADFYAQVTQHTTKLRKVTETAMRKEQRALEARVTWGAYAVDETAPPVEPTEPE